MTTLKQLEALGLEIITQNELVLAQRKQAEEDQRAASIEQTRQAIILYLSGGDGGLADELDPLVDAYQKYGAHCSYNSHIKVPGTNQRIVFYYSLKLDKAGRDFDAVPGRTFPFSVEHAKAFYKTLGEAFAAARVRQVAVDEYSAIADAEDEAYARRKREHDANEAAERDDRIAILRTAINEYPMLFPLFQTIAIYVSEKADLLDELDSC